MVVWLVEGLEDLVFGLGCGGGPEVVEGGLEEIGFGGLEIRVGGGVGGALCALCAFAVSCS